jgi:hypothetical protein
VLREGEQSVPSRHDRVGLSVPCMATTIQPGRCVPARPACNYRTAVTRSAPAHASLPGVRGIHGGVGNIPGIARSSGAGVGTIPESAHCACTGQPLFTPCVASSTATTPSRKFWGCRANHRPGCRVWRGVGDDVPGGAGRAEGSRAVGD